MFITIQISCPKSGFIEIYPLSLLIVNTITIITITCKHKICTCTLHKFTLYFYLIVKKTNTATTNIIVTSIQHRFDEVTDYHTSDYTVLLL